MLLLIISMIIATTAPSLSYECALILLIAFMGILCGKVRYSIIGTIVFLALYLFTTLYLGNVTGTAYTMFTAWLSLVFKVYPCGMLAGIAVSTTRVNEFLSAMNKAHVPKKVVIPLAVMLRYLPTIREDWRFIKDAMRLRYRPEYSTFYFDSFWCLQSYRQEMHQLNLQHTFPSASP